MKKTLFVSSLCFLLAGGVLKPNHTPVSAETPSGVKQLVTDSTQTFSAVRTKVELLGTGTEPKQELRFKPAVNAKQTMTVTLTMDMASSLEGQPLPKLKIPTSVMKMEGTVTQVDANGDIHYQLSYTDADVVADSTVEPELANTLRSAIKKIVGLKSSFVIDNRGQLKSSNVSLPEGLDPMTKQLSEQLINSLSQLSTPAPTEAVGIGAKWRASSSLNIGGVNLSQTTLYELVSRQDNVTTLNTTVEQQGELQNLPTPGLPNGMVLTLKSLKSQGQGQMALHGEGIMPIRGNVSIRSNNEMSLKKADDGEEVTLSMQAAVQVSLESQFQK
jgi:hypothetical protein